MTTVNAPWSSIARARMRRYTFFMPSHVAHLLFADDVVSAMSSSLNSNPLVEPPNHAYLALGAQGPDIFYHNQRTRPTSIGYGSLMHRRGYGTCVAKMCAWAGRHDLELSSWAGALIIGFATHAVLDRHTHPFINAYSGWPEPDDPATQKYRSMHPFLERLIDVELLKMRRAIHPNELHFHSRVTCGEEPPTAWVKVMTNGLTGAYRKAKLDTKLEARVRNAYRDTMGFYRFTDRIDEAYLEEAIAREDAGRIGSRWLSIIHPLEVPADLDVLNTSKRPWPHPCSDDASTRSFLDCYDEALETARAMANRIAVAWRGSRVDEEEIESAVANWNLNDGRPTERPCKKRFAQPLPLHELQARMRESIRAGSAGRL